MGSFSGIKGVTDKAVESHALGSADHTPSTLAELNTKVSDATLDDASSPRTPSSHELGGAEHASSTLAELNAKISDATLDDASSTRPPQAHTHVEADITDLDHTDPTALHTDAGNEISALPVKGSPAANDLLIIEDSAAMFTKKKVAVSSLSGGGNDPDAVHYSVSFEFGSNVAQKVTPTEFDQILIEDSDDGGLKKFITVGSLPSGASGIVTISPNALDGADYTFTGTASYAAAVADPRIAKGGILYFMQGVYSFNTNPSWAPVLHLGAGQWKTSLELPNGQTSTGSDTDGQYIFEGLQLTVPGGSFGGAGAGTHTITWGGNMRSVLRNCITDYDMRWQPANGNWPHVIEGCSLGYYGPPTVFEWFNTQVFCHNVWFTGPVHINEQTGMRVWGADSLQLHYTGVLDSSQLVALSGINGPTLFKTSTGNLTNLRVMGCSSNGSPPVGFAGHWVGNEATDIRGTVV